MAPAAMRRKSLFLRRLAIERFKACDRDLHAIIPGIFLGSCGAANNKEGIEATGVTHVLCVANNLLDEVKTSTATLHLKYLEISIEDKPGCMITEIFPECFKFIDLALAGGGKVLVHCFQGKSRSSSVVIGYLMNKKGMLFQQSLEFVKSKRAVIAPNIGFALQLRKYERYLLGANAASTVHVDRRRARQSEIRGTSQHQVNSQRTDGKEAQSQPLDNNVHSDQDTPP